MSARHVGGSLLPSNDPNILQPLAHVSGYLLVRIVPELDTHSLYLVTPAGETKLASHPNGCSCRALADRMVSGDAKRVSEQAKYIVDCGGSVDLAAIASATGGNQS